MKPGFLLVLLLILSSCASTAVEMSDLAKASCNLHEKVSLVVSNYKKLRFVTTGIYRSDDGTIKTLTYRFQINQPLTLEEARILIIELAEKILKAVNTDTFSRPWLTTFPFNYDSLDVGVYIHDHDGDFLNHPDLCLVKIVKKNINYITQKSGFIPKSIETTEEPFEEVYLKVKGKKFDIMDYLRG